MAFKTFTLAADVQKTLESIGALKLIDGQYAASLLPSDTKFALAIEAIQKNANEGFAETDLNKTTMRITWSHEGYVGNFIGYLSLTDDKVRIYKALDMDATKIDKPHPSLDSLTQTPDSLMLLLEDAISNISSSTDGGLYVISNGQQKFKLLGLFQINNIQSRFESRARDQGDFKPLFAYMQQRGAKVQIISSYWIWFVIVGFFVLFVALYILKK